MKVDINYVCVHCLFPEIGPNFLHCHPAVHVLVPPQEGKDRKMQLENYNILFR